jgi:hypothetical protein
MLSLSDWSLLSMDNVHHIARHQPSCWKCRGAVSCSVVRLSVCEGQPHYAHSPPRVLYIQVIGFRHLLPSHLHATYSQEWIPSVLQPQLQVFWRQLSPSLTSWGRMYRLREIRPKLLDTCILKFKALGLYYQHSKVLHKIWTLYQLSMLLLFKSTILSLS